MMPLPDLELIGNEKIESIEDGKVLGWLEELCEPRHNLISLSLVSLSFHTI